MAHQYKECFERTVSGLSVQNKEQIACFGENASILNFTSERNIFSANNWQKKLLEDKSNGVLSSFMPGCTNDCHEDNFLLCDPVKGFRDASRLDVDCRHKCSQSPPSLDSYRSQQSDVYLTSANGLLETDDKPAFSSVNSNQSAKSLSRVDNLPLRKVMSLRFAAMVTKSECEMSPPSFSSLSWSEKYSPDSANSLPDTAVRNTSNFCPAPYSSSDMSSKNSCKELHFSAQPATETVDLSLGSGHKQNSHSLHLTTDVSPLSGYSDEYFDSCLEKDQRKISLISENDEELSESPPKRSRSKADEQAVSTSNSSGSGIAGHASRRGKRAEKPAQRNRKGTECSSKVGAGDKDADEKPHTTCRLDLPSQMDNGFCQVCGDIAAGFYCGAFICEACKVSRALFFFLKHILEVYNSD